MFRLDVVDPVLPAWYDVTFSVLPVLLGVLWISALISIARRAPRLRGLEVIGWFLFVTIAPVVGPLVWFLVGRRLTAPSDATREVQGVAP